MTMTTTSSQRRMDVLERRMDTRMDDLERRMDTRMNGLERRMDGLERRMDGVETQLGSLAKSVEAIHAAMREGQYLPINSIIRNMKKVLPANANIAKDAKDTMQECVTEFINCVTSEATRKCLSENRKLITGEDFLTAMATFGFEDYIEQLKVYLARYRQLEHNTKRSATSGDGSARGDQVGLAGQNAQVQPQHQGNPSMNR